ncbi:Hypothetical protein A7982_00381 [Minicystis rosea]|nr:Hypothetical protein A7982_00381 [Minicystis rosea]
MTDPATFRYQAFYCEENIYHLATEPIVASRPRAVVFISNRTHRTAMWNQRAAGAPGQVIIWDYHVVLLVEDPWEVWDLDTHLGCPVPAADYLRESFNPHVLPQFLPSFRLVDADLFATSFASDRTHMIKKRGRYERPPPPWPCIGVPDREPNLMRFVDMTTPFLGEVLDLAELARRVGAS